MGEVDRQRVTAVKTLDALGYVYRDGEGWRPPQPSVQWHEADAHYRLLVERADHLSKHRFGPDGTAEARTIAKALEAYEATRWLGGRKVGSKG